MKIGTPQMLSRHQSAARCAAHVVTATLLVGSVIYSAIVAKEARLAPPLLSVTNVIDRPSPAEFAPEIVPAADTASIADLPDPEFNQAPTDEFVGPESPDFAPTDPLAYDASVRWFNGRPVRPVRRMTMTVTGYSPDERSCGDSADGITATLHSVNTNASRLVAADPRVLTYGSMITVPGYDSGNIVPVLDCGGAIKGRRLDLLFPTHEQARAWGVKRIDVVVWGYADGKPAENPRRVR